jgi:hypothetical protein
MAKSLKSKYRNLAIFNKCFPHWWRLKPSKITSFSNFEYLISLFGEISPEKE